MNLYIEVQLSRRRLIVQRLKATLWVSLNPLFLFISSNSILLNRFQYPSSRFLKHAVVIIENNVLQSLVHANAFFGRPASLGGRIFTECYATDSFQNILFPLLFFPRFVGLISKSCSTSPPPQYLDHPSHLIIVSHAFKRHRFVALHLCALKYPVTQERLRYIGIDPPMDKAKRTEVEAGELSRGFKAWEQDPYGVGRILVEKRRVRGWTVEQEVALWTEVSSNAEVSKHKDVMTFLEWLRARSGGEISYSGILPWS